MLASAYLYRLTRLWRQFRKMPIESWRLVMAFLGFTTVFLAVQGPLHDLAESYLFSAHMIQHLMLQFVMPPLILLGAPGALLWPALKPKGVIRVLRVCVHPLGAFILFNVALVGWHLPPLYDLALENHNLHISQHVIFMIVGLIAWWPLLGSLEQLPRPHPSVQMLYLFAQSIPMGFLGAIITFASEPLAGAFSPLGEAGVGVDFQEQPGLGGGAQQLAGVRVADLLTGRDGKFIGADAADFHAVRSFSRDESEGQIASPGKSAAETAK